MVDELWRSQDPVTPMSSGGSSSQWEYFGTAARPPAVSYSPQAAPERPAESTFHAYVPYRAPLPKRGGYKRLLLILGTVGLLVLGGCGVGIYFAASSVSKDIHAANVFLGDVHNKQFAAAYQRLCPSEQHRGTETQFAGLLQTAAARGHGVSRFDIKSASTTENFGSDSGTTRTAGGTVTFTSGDSAHVTFDLGSSGGQLCISSGYEVLF